jgi:hypothetical protein
LAQPALSGLAVLKFVSCCRATADKDSKKAANNNLYRSMLGKMENVL